MQAVVLAAGESSRFWPLNGQHKTTCSLWGRAVIEWTVRGLAESGADEIIVVVAPDSRIPETLGEKETAATLRFVEQKSPTGSGDAISLAREYITGPFFVAWPDKVESAQLAADLKEAGGIALAGAETDRPKEYGVFRFEQGRAVQIIENPEEPPSGIYFGGMALLPEDFFSYLDRYAKGEARYIDALNALMVERDVRVVLRERLSSLKYPWDALSLLPQLADLQESGVSPDATVAGTAVLRGAVTVQTGAVVGEHTVIEGPAYVGRDCVVGHHNVLRGPVSLERGVKTGAFCEIKNSVLQEETHLHSGYVGDSIIGAGCRIGGAFMTTNRRLDRESVRVVLKGKKVDSGRTWLGTAVGKGAVVGARTTVMPGVFVGSNAVVGPDSVLFEHVGDGEVFKQNR